MKKWQGILLVSGAVTVCLAIVIGVIMAKSQAKGYADRGLPVMNIELTGTELDTIKTGNKETKYGGNRMDLISDNEVTEFTGVEIKGRGNATWAQDKKPYQIKFEEKVDLLGLGAGRKWVLLANYLDDTSLRNAVSFGVAEMIGMDFAPQGKFVELYVNGAYEGLYYLTRKTEIAKNSVNLKSPDGILVELDNIYGKYEVYYQSGKGNCLVVKDVKEKGREDELMGKFLTDFNKMEIAAEQGDYATFSEVADVESFAKYFLISEFIVDVDAYLTSEYFYQDGGKIFAGPVWDYDMTFGNDKWRITFDPTVDLPLKNEVIGNEIYDPETGEIIPGMVYDTGSGEAVEWNQYYHVTKIFYQLMEMPEFRAQVEQQFREKLSGREQEMLIMVRQIVNTIREARHVDAEKWNKFDYEEETETLIDWIRLRYRHMEQMYGEGAKGSVI